MLYLPISKADPTGAGVWRTHGCACPSALCPVAAVRKLLQASPPAGGWLQGAEGEAPLAPTAT
eukprot:10331498-Alexandrium_andersonii.AAC.1